MAGVVNFFQGITTFSILLQILKIRTVSASECIGHHGKYPYKYILDYQSRNLQPYQAADRAYSLQNISSLDSVV
jgi:hypothetical protein